MPTYSEIRKQELKHIEQSLKDDNEYRRKLSRLHNSAQENIRREISADIERFATSEGISMAEAKKRISKMDVEAFQEKAKFYVEAKDFSPEANRQLKLYNVTLRTNREELLYARVNLEVVALANEEDKELRTYLLNKFIEEQTRQAGILGITIPSQNEIERLFRSVVLSDVSGATFSDRIWRDQKMLTHRINETIEQALINGRNPRTAVTDIMRLVKDDVGMKRRKAERIAITETTRAQGISFRESLKVAGIDKYIWIAESKPCPDCKELDGQVFDLKDFEAFKNAIPKHPNCLCSLAAYVE